MTKRPNLLAGEDLPPAPVQKRSLEKRARLKAAALALFAEKGYEATSMEDIAGRARVAIGSCYQHYRSKRQLLLALMDELLEKLSRIDLQPSAGSPTRSVSARRGEGSKDVLAGLRAMLARAFSQDLSYLGAYRAWQEAALSDPGLARKQRQMHAWTTSRVEAIFKFLHQLPGARPGVDLPALAHVMDHFFWSLLAQAAAMSEAELNQWIDSSTHLIYHALFKDPD